MELYRYELKIRKEIECYDKVMESRPKYPQIWYNLGLEYKQIVKKHLCRIITINKKRYEHELL